MMPHTHPHAISPGHSPVPPSEPNAYRAFISGATRRMGLALFITLAFVVLEALAGLFANSLALLTDAAHNFTDAIALILSWVALRLALRPANASRTFGYHRAGILVALVNSTTLVLIALGIFYEAYRRLVDPPEVNAPVLIGVGTIALLVNLVTAWLVHQGSQNDLNLRSAFVHLMGDVLSTLGAILAGIAILFTGWYWLDPLVSVLIGLLILWNAWGILRQTLNILLESSPEDIDVDELVGSLRQVEGVIDVHDLHVWSINQSWRMLSAHIVSEDIPISESAAILERVNAFLADKYNIQHTTLQLECVDCNSNMLYCEAGELTYSKN